MNIIKIGNYLQIRITSENRFSIDMSDNSEILFSNLKFENDIQVISQDLSSYIEETENSLKNEKNIEVIKKTLKNKVEEFLQSSQISEDSDDLLDLEENSFNTSHKISDKNEELIRKIIEGIEIVNNPNDKRFTWHGKSNGSSLVKGHSREEVEEQIEMIGESIKEMFEEGEIISIVKGKHGDKNYHGVANTKEALYDLSFEGRDDFSISSNNLVTFFKKPCFVRSEYIMTEEQYKEVLKNLEDQFGDEEYFKKVSKENLRREFAGLLKNDQESIKFSQDTYFEEIKKAYKEMIKEEYQNEYTKGTIKGFGPIRLTKNFEGDIVVIDGSHRVLALMETYKDKHLQFFREWRKRLEKIIDNIDIIEDKANLTPGLFTKDDLEKGNINEIDSVDNENIRKILKNILDPETYKNIMDK